MRAGKSPATAAHDPRINGSRPCSPAYCPYLLYLFSRSCSLRRIKCVIRPNQNISAACFSGLFLLNPVLPDHSRLRPIAAASGTILRSRSRSMKIHFISVISGKVWALPSDRFFRLVSSGSHLAPIVTALICHPERHLATNRSEVESKLSRACGRLSPQAKSRAKSRELRRTPRIFSSIYTASGSSHNTWPALGHGLRAKSQ